VIEGSYVAVGDTCYAYGDWVEAFHGAALEVMLGRVPEGAEVGQVVRALRGCRNVETVQRVRRLAIQKVQEAPGSALADVRERGTIVAVFPVDNKVAPR